MGCKCGVRVSNSEDKLLTGNKRMKTWEHKSYKSRKPAERPARQSKKHTSRTSMYPYSMPALLLLALRGATAQFPECSTFNPKSRGEYGPLFSGDVRYCEPLPTLAEENALLSVLLCDRASGRGYSEMGGITAAAVNACTAYENYDKDETLDAETASAWFASASDACEAARAMLNAQWQEAGRSVCCGGVMYDSDDYEPQLVCLRGSIETWLVAVPLALLIAALLIMWMRRRRSIGAPALQSSESRPLRDAADAETPDVPQKLMQESLAATLLDELTTNDAADAPSQHAQRRKRIFADFRQRFGFQQSNADNQEEHLTSLVVSYLARSGGDYKRAVRDLHTKLLRPVEAWREAVLRHPSSQEKTVKERPAASKGPWIDAPVAFAEENEVLESEAQPATVVTQKGIMSLWVQLPTEEMEREIVLYLLVWGEASNLRFMPELLCFLFEIAREWMPPADAPAAKEKAFLRQVVTPIYERIWAEHSQYGSKEFLTNYDDWNESFWNARKLHSLTTNDGRSVLNAWPAQRWPLLLQADWSSFFGSIEKTHYEQRWWFCMLAANRRIFLLHAMIFGFIVMAVMASVNEDDYSWELNGWGAWRVLPFLLLVPFFSALFGRSFSAWTHASTANLASLYRAVLAFGAGLVLGVMTLQIQSNLSFYDFESGSLQQYEPIAFVICMLLLFLGSLLVLVREMLPEAAGPDALDDNIFFESRTRRLVYAGIWRSARKYARAPGLLWRACCACCPRLKQEAIDVLKLYGFWAMLFLLKALFAGLVLVPIVLRAHSDLILAYNNEAVLDDFDNKYEWKVWLESPEVLTAFLVIMLWCTAVMVFLSDTLGFYQLFLGLWGGIAGLVIGGFGQNRDKFDFVHLRDLRISAASKLCAGLASSRAVATRLTGLRFDRPLRWPGIMKDVFGATPSGGTGHDSESDSNRVRSATTALWRAVVEDLYAMCHVTKSERAALLDRFEVCVNNLDAGLVSTTKQSGVDTSAVKLRSPEARRRLQFFWRSLKSSEMPFSDGALQMPGLSVMIPCYAEAFVLFLPGAKKTGKGPGYKALGFKEDRFIRDYFDDEWKVFKQQLEDERALLPPAERAALLPPEDDPDLPQRRDWATGRYQAMGRTVKGMMKYWKALSLHLEAELPDVPAEQRRRLLGAKFRCVAALQAYANFDEHVLEDVTRMLEANRHGLAISYIERRCVTHADELAQLQPGGAPVLVRKEDVRYFACLIDGTLREGDGFRMAPSFVIEDDKKDKTRCQISRKPLDRLAPTFEIELPGNPVYNGKADNQNASIIFTRGDIIEAIDMNQEGYMEEALKLPCILKEFQIPAAGGTSPSIVGFKEHIFSSIGALGDFAASSERVFGTLAQRTMAYPLWSRCHYGHPDFMNKLDQMAQGGISKGDKRLNLSEDIFTGMDAILRGRHIAYRDYFQVGKGRDMGVDSILGFFSKLSVGTAEMTTTRQAFRLGNRLAFGRLLGFYYAHIGSYVGQLHYYHSSYMLLALSFLGAVADGTQVLPGAAKPAAALMDSMYGFLSVLFILSSMLPLVFVLLKEEGWRSALTTPLRHLSRLSPVYFLVQSRVIGASFARELSQGGGGYVATGRGLGIFHINFHKIYTFLAEASFYPAMDFLLLLVLWPFATNHIHVGGFALFFAWLTTVSLLFGPSIFNPGCFNNRLSCLPKSCRSRSADEDAGVFTDFGSWASWLVAPEGAPKRNADTSWLDYYHRRQIGKRPLEKDERPVEWYSFLLPSKEMLMAIPLLVITYKSMQQYGWDVLRMVIVAVPIVPFLLVLVVNTLGGLSRAALRCASKEAESKLSPGGRATSIYMLALAAIFSLCFAAELYLVASDKPELRAAIWVALISARFFAWRAVMNTLVYVSGAIGWVKSWRFAPIRVVLGLLTRSLTETAMGHALLVDVSLGFSLQAPLIVLSFVPGLPALHARWLGVRLRVLDINRVFKGSTRADGRQQPVDAAMPAPFARKASHSRVEIRQAQ